MMEILAPAGSFEKLKYAVQYGADAVYCAGKNYGLRSKATNFSNEELVKAVEYCHSEKKKIYVTLNIFLKNDDIDFLPEYLTFLNDINVDAVIVSDPAVFAMVKEYAPGIEIHISTQANVTSWRAAKYWYDQGARRVIVARELTLKEIRTIKEKVPGLELEMFVHGAMCISYSGRCLLSSFINNRSANQGNCTQVCRWNFAVVEKERPNETFDLLEDKFGTYILNSKDLNLWRRIKEIKKSGIDSIKIEGRMKSLYYVSLVTRSYKWAVLNANKLSETDKYFEDLFKVSHRVYSEGFFDGFDSNDMQYYKSSAYIRNYQFLGEILEVKNNFVILNMRAKFTIRDVIDFVFPNADDDFSFSIENIYNEFDEEIESTKPNTIVKLKINKKIPEIGIIRKKVL